MPSPEQTATRSFRRNIILAICVLALTSLALFFAIHFYAAHRLKQVTREIAAAGYPVTVEELDRFYDPGPGAAENGQAIVRAFERRDIKPVGDPKPLLLSGPSSPGSVLNESSIQATREVVKRNRAFLDEIVRLVDANNAVRYPIDFNAEPAPYDQIPDSVLLISMDALLAGLDSDAERTVACMNAAYRLANTLRHEPTLDSQIVRLVSFNIATDALEVILAEAALTNQQLLRLQETIADVRDDDALIRGLVGHRCLSIAHLDRPVDTPNVIYVVLLRPYGQIECVTFAESMSRLIDIAKLPPPDRVKAASEFNASLNGLPSFSHLRVKSSGPTIARCISHDVRTAAYLSAASVAIAAYRFEQDHNRFPKELSELVPDYMSNVEADPFDGKPLRYITSEKGAVVYSIGHDGDDDGGVLPPDDKTIAQDGDIVFRLVAH